MGIEKTLYRLNDKWLTTNPKIAYKQICSCMAELEGVYFSEYLYGSTAFKVGIRVGRIY